MPVATFRFEDFALELATGELRRAAETVPIQGKPLALLVCLLQNQGRVATKDELLAQVWPGVVVSESALTSALRDLRRALGDDASPHRLIVTIRGKGYRFAGSTAATAQSDATASCERASADADPFVERAEVLAQLERSLLAAEQGALRISLLAGPAGIGKTRTALELVRIARNRGIEVVLTRCYGGDGATPFWPWLELVRRALLQIDGSELSARERSLLQPLTSLAPALGEQRASDQRRDSDRLAERFRLFEAFATLARAYCRVRPVLVVIDDLHWGDEASLLLFEFVAQQLHDAPLQLVGTLRDGEVRSDHPLARVLGTIAGQPGAERIDLIGLKSESVAALLRAAAGREASPGFVDKVHRATAGNPFFVAEIARLLAAGQLDPCTDGAEMPVPARVRDAVRLHVKRRSSECEALLKLASVVGRHVELVPLAGAFGVTQARALDLLDEAEAAGLLRRVEGHGGRYAFVHDLVRETLYRDLGARARIELHRQMAAALEAQAVDERLEELAYHYGEAAEAWPDAARKALHYAQRAAQRAISLMAYEDAAAQYDRALNAYQLLEVGEPEQSAQLLLSRAEAAWGTLEDAQRVQQRFELAAQAAREIGSPVLLARSALGRSGHGAGPGDFRDIAAIDRTDIELLSEACTALGGQRTALEALVLSRLSLAIIHLDTERAGVLSERAVAIASALDDAETLASVLRYRHEVRSGPQHARERLVLARRLLELGRQVGSRAIELDALYFVSRDHLELGEIAESADQGRAADALAKSMLHPGARFRSGTRRVLVLTLRGAFDDALSASNTCFARDAVRNLSARGTLRAQRIAIHAARGDYDAVLVDLAEESREARVWPLSRYTKAHTCLALGALGHGEFAHREFELAARDGFANIPRDHTLLASVCLLADLCLAFADRGRAEQLYRIAEPFADMVAAPYLATVCTCAAGRGLGVLAHTLGRFRQAESHFERALELERKLASPPLVAETLARYGRMLLARAAPGDAERARALVCESEAIAARLGLVLWRARIAAVTESAASPG